MFHAAGFLYAFRRLSFSVLQAIAATPMMMNAFFFLSFSPRRCRCRRFRFAMMLLFSLLAAATYRRFRHHIFAAADFSLLPDG
jgi:hypothetical protein